MMAGLAGLADRGSGAVALDCLGADVQLTRDLLVRHALRDQARHPVFLGAQHGAQVGRSGGDRPQAARRQIRVAACESA